MVTLNQLIASGDDYDECPECGGFVEEYSVADGEVHIRFEPCGHLMPGEVIEGQVVRVSMPATTDVTFELYDETPTAPAKPALPLPNALEETNDG